MDEITAKAKKWGNSVGVILPKKLGIKPNEEVSFFITKGKFTKVKDIWGTLPMKIPTQKLMKMIDKDIDSEF